MVFSSITFLFYFLPLFLVLYFITPFKNTVLLIASLLFYAWGEAGYVLLLLVSIGLNYLFGILIDKNFNLTKKTVLVSGIVINLVLLGYYKYFNFLGENISFFKAESQVHLPLGISFFTFQAISYLFDVYRKEARVEKNIFNLALYISMFPQLIAGPIVRFKTVAEQIHTRFHTLDNISKGVRIFIIGLAQKALIANTVAVSADAIFALNQASLTTSTAWLGAFSYSLQIYFDFAGYSNMAIGLGLIMGFSFPQNFNYPYISKSITEFWRRWHMSLSSWFRDYLYIPLGGNRVSPFRTYINLMVVFLLCGLWHGAAWTFIIWGAYHGFFLILERLGFKKLLDTSWRLFSHTYTLFVVVIGWVIFRAEDFNHLVYFLKTMFGLGQGQTIEFVPSLYLTSSLSVTLIFATVFSMPIYHFLFRQMNMKEYLQIDIKVTILKIMFEMYYISIFLLSLLNIASGSYNPFIYFRF
ncbi:MAG TPA: MBOAT family O-acyltransferase [Gammaproteobacteria bacterium]|jgi:alginate O-acetyltransferase complex protein AlgI|nr:MBOAT family O-acyltransferase [Gammaproteobacteria bacterium]